MKEAEKRKKEINVVYYSNDIKFNAAFPISGINT
jgi:hypothetical protein